MTRFSTALRYDARRRIEKMGEADVVIGIPSYNTQDTIAHVVETAAQGVSTYCPKLRCLIMVCDGGSVDDTREEAQRVDVSTFGTEKIVTIYRGLPGKGSAVRGILEAALLLKSWVVVLLDADLRSITPAWIPNLVDPVLEEGYDFVAPYYRRYRFDGTITNTLAYSMTRALYGKRIRQPIGGDFAISRPLLRACLEEDVWETDIARFGIDIWLTTLAIVRGFCIAQTYLGVKIHDVKDPAEHLSPMFRQVVGTIFSLMEVYESYWKKIRGSMEVPLLRIRDEVENNPIPFPINTSALIEYFRLGLKNFGPVWKQVVGTRIYAEVKRLAALSPDKFYFPVDLWVRVVYSFAVAFRDSPRQRLKLVDLMIPLYNARVASLANELATLSDEAVEAYFENQAQTFEELKPYLLRKWNRKV